MSNLELREHIKWTGFLIARLGYLAGEGKTSQEIAGDPEFRTYARVIEKAALLYSLPVSRQRSAARLDIRLPQETMEAFSKIASSRGLSGVQLMKMVLCECAEAGPSLVWNIIE